MKDDYTDGDRLTRLLQEPEETFKILRQTQ